MNLEELLNTKENERLKTEINLLREHLRDAQNDYEELKEFMTSDCIALTNRCWTLTHGAMCIFCELDAFKCPHAMIDDQKIKATKKMMRKLNSSCWGNYTFELSTEDIMALLKGKTLATDNGEYGIFIKLEDKNA